MADQANQVTDQEGHGTTNQVPNITTSLADLQLREETLARIADHVSNAVSAAQIQPTASLNEQQQSTPRPK